MKIALFASSGGSYLPEIVKKKLEQLNKWDSRTIAEEIDKLPYTHEVLTEQAFYDATTDYIREKGSDSIYCISNEYGYKHTSEIKLVEVDTSRPWRICEYDGAEYLEYFNGLTVIDSETNESKW